MGVFGGVAATGTAASAVLFNIMSSDFQRSMSRGDSYKASEYQLGQTFATATNIGMIASGVLLGGALLYGLWPSSEPKTAATPAPQPPPAPRQVAPAPKPKPAPPPPPPKPAKPPVSDKDEFD
jgi:hypothetical protein